MEPSPAHQRPRLNRLRALWAEGRCALGAIATIPSAQVVQLLAASGLDFINGEAALSDAPKIEAMPGAASAERSRTVGIIGAG